MWPRDLLSKELPNTAMFLVHMTHNLVDDPSEGERVVSVPPPWLPLWPLILEDFSDFVVICCDFFCYGSVQVTKAGLESSHHPSLSIF